MAIIVADIERSAQFYEQALGYRRTLSATIGGEGLEESLHLPAGVTGRIQYLQGATQLGQIELIQWDRESGEGEAPAHRRASHNTLGAFLLSFQVPREELGELYERFLSLGAECLTAPKRKLLSNYGWIEAFAARDPDGNLMEFVSLPTREEIKAFRATEAVG